MTGDAADNPVELGRRLELFVGDRMKPKADASGQSPAENADEVKFSWQRQD